MRVKLTGLVLAGGQSRRMGHNKALLELHGQKVIQRITDQLSQVVDQVYISANDEELYSFLNLGVVKDRYVQCGPLAGLHAGLIRSDTPWILVVACDLPFISAELIQLLADYTSSFNPGLGGNYQAVIPYIGGHLQPLVAAYHQSVLSSLEQSLEQGELKMKQWTDQLRVCTIDEKQLIASLGGQAEDLFFNMNTVDDLAVARSKEQ